MRCLMPLISAGCAYAIEGTRITEMMAPAVPSPGD
jgi:hypothetical protein